MSDLLPLITVQADGYFVSTQPIINPLTSSQKRVVDSTKALQCLSTRYLRLDCR